MNLEDLTFFDPWRSIKQQKNRLPHWQQPGATYYVTFRLGDALPASLLTEWRSEREIWIKHHPDPWDEKVDQEYHQRFLTRQKSGSIRGTGAVRYGLKNSDI